MIPVPPDTVVEPVQWIAYVGRDYLIPAFLAVYGASLGARIYFDIRFWRKMRQEQLEWERQFNERRENPPRE